MALMDIVKSALTPEVVGGIAQYLGAQNKNTQSAIFQAAVPVLIGALAKNSNQQQGAESINSALQKDHDGSILENIAGYLSQSSAGPGAGILKHVFGAQRPRVESQIGQQSGLAPGQTAQLLQMLAPIVMGALGKQQRQQKLDTSGVQGYLGQERKVAEKEAASPDLLTSLLDSDGDGSVGIGDVLSKAGPLLGSLFGGKS